jgi:hypothetical protein
MVGIVYNYRFMVMVAEGGFGLSGYISMVRLHR